MAVSSIFQQIKIVIRGGGDLGSGVAYRLHRAGFPVLITERPDPFMVRRAVSFGSAVIEDEISIEGLTARLSPTLNHAEELITQDTIAVLVDPDGKDLATFSPDVLIDARMLKSDPGRQPIPDALIIGLGPGFISPDNCYALIETKRGHNLGRVIRQGAAEANTGVPGWVQGRGAERILRAPTAGNIQGVAAIGDMLIEGQLIAKVDDKPILAPFDGVLRGLVHDGLHVEAGLKVGDLDPRGIRENCFTISDKSLAIGGGVLEAILSTEVIQKKIMQGN